MFYRNNEKKRNGVRSAAVVTVDVLIEEAEVGKDANW